MDRKKTYAGDTFVESLSLVHPRARDLGARDIPKDIPKEIPKDIVSQQLDVLEKALEQNVLELEQAPNIDTWNEEETPLPGFGHQVWPSDLGRRQRPLLDGSLTTENIKDKNSNKSDRSQVQYTVDDASRDIDDVPEVSLPGQSDRRLDVGGLPRHLLDGSLTSQSLKDENFNKSDRSQVQYRIDDASRDIDDVPEISLPGQSDRTSDLGNLPRHLLVKNIKDKMSSKSDRSQVQYTIEDASRDVDDVPEISLLGQADRTSDWENLPRPLLDGSCTSKSIKDETSSNKSDKAQVKCTIDDVARSINDVPQSPLPGQSPRGSGLRHLSRPGSWTAKSIKDENSANKSDKLESQRAWADALARDTLKSQGFKEFGRKIKEDSTSGILHGEIWHESSASVQKFLLVPFSMRMESEQIFSAMFDPDGWNLNVPGMTIAVQGPEGFWPNSVEESFYRDRWGHNEESRKANFEESVCALCESVARASVESKAWVWSNWLSYYSQDNAGVCTKSGIRRFLEGDPIASKHLVYAGIKPLDRQNDAGYPMLRFPTEIDLAKYAVPLGHPVTRRLYIPEVEGAIWPTDEKCGAAHDALPDWPTHVIFMSDQNRGDMRLEALLTRVIPHASVVIGGVAWSATKPRVIDFCIELTERGCLCVLMNETGMWVEILAQAVKNRREVLESERNIDKENKALIDLSGERSSFPPDGVDYPISALIAEEKKEIYKDTIEQNMDRTKKGLEKCKGLHKFIIFDALVDSPEKVVDKLTSALSTVAGEATNEIGSEQPEHERISYAWEMHLLFGYNASRQWSFALKVHWSIILASLMTTALAVFLSATEIPDNGAASDRAFLEVPSQPKLSEGAFDFLAFMTAAFPLISTFLLSLSSKFNPLRRFGALIVGSQRIRAEIYRYRARISEYSRSSNSATIQRILSQRQLIPPLPTAQNRKAGDASSKDRSATLAGERTQMKNSASIFADTLSALHNELMAAHTASGSLRKPPPNAFEELARSLFTSQKQQATTSNKKDAKAVMPQFMLRSLSMLSPSDYTFMSAQYAGADAPFDDGMGVISAEHYITFRMGPHIKSLNETVPFLEWCNSIHQVFIFFGTAVSGAFSLIGLRVWIPLVMAAVAAANSLADFHCIAARLACTNASLTQLKNLKIWWQSLSRLQKRNRENKMYLVEATEDAILASVEVWNQGMIRKRKHFNKDEDEED